MKRLLIVSVFAVLPFAAHSADLSSDYNFIQDNAPAQPAVVGHLSLGIGYANEHPNAGPDYDFWQFEGVGRANVNFGALNFELETGGRATVHDGQSYSAVGATGHLWGGMDNFALGVFGTVTFPTGGTVYSVGTEFEAYLGALTLGADINYDWFDTCCGSAEGWETRGWADLYLAANTRVGAEIDYVDSDAIDGNWIAALDAEHRFAGTPVSAWIEGKYKHLDVGSYESETWSGMGGFRVFMDGAGTTLHQHNKLVPWERRAGAPGS